MEDKAPAIRRNRPPTGQERDTIYLLISKEQKSLNFLRQQEAHWRDTLEEAHNAVSKQLIVLNRAQMQSKSVSELMDAMEKSLESMAIISLDTDEGVELQPLQRSRKSQKRVVDLLGNEISGIKACVREALQAVDVAAEDFQAALEVERLTSKSLEVCLSQENLIEQSINEKRDRFRSIWRIPEDIWVAIFQELVSFQPNNHEPLQEIPGTLRSWPWHQSMIPLTVCHRWRIIAKANSRLWQDFGLALRGKDAMLQHSFDRHISLNSGICRTLIVFMPDGDHERITDITGKIRSVESLHCDITRIGPKLIEDLWATLPKLKRLSIVDFSDVFDEPYHLPLHLCASITHLYINGQCPVIPVGSMSLLDTFIVDCSIDMPWIHHIIRSSANTLRYLSVIGRLNSCFDSSRIALNRLEEVSMTIPNLITLGSAYTMPSLHKFGIFPSVGTEGTWRDLLNRDGYSSSIQKVLINTMGFDDAKVLLPHLSHLKRVNYLELHGDSIDCILQARIDAVKSAPILSFFDGLETLKLVTYNGSAEVLLEFLKVTRANRRNTSIKGSGSTLLDLIFVECPGITPDIRRRINQKLRL